MLDSHDLLARHPCLEVCRVELDQALDLLRRTFERDGKLLVCGNGGSAADADHITGELLKGFHLPRPLSARSRARLGEELAANLQDALPAIPLTAFPAFSSAFANDLDARYAFAQLVWALGRTGDALLAISTSGRSANVLHAARVSRARGLAVVALTGEAGGPLAALADVCIRVPARAVHEVQELHLPVYHHLCAALEEHFFGAGAGRRPTSILPPSRESQPCASS